MKNQYVLILNIDELWLKGSNRPLYFRELKKHIKLVTELLHGEKYKIDIENHRFILKSEMIFSKETIEGIKKIPGLHSIIPALLIKKENKLIYPAVLSELKKRNLTGIKTFRVITKRADKNFSPDSMAVSRRAGSVIQEEFDSLDVDLKNPDITIEIRILADHIFISFEKIKATGGLPVGTGGRLVTLLSGGIDSPVASFLMSKRGCSQTFIFFYAYPLVAASVKDKISKTCRDTFSLSEIFISLYCTVREFSEKTFRHL